MMQELAMLASLAVYTVVNWSGTNVTEIYEHSLFLMISKSVWTNKHLNTVTNNMPILFCGELVLS
jgi:hypothetical protein